MQPFSTNSRLGRPACPLNGQAGTLWARSAGRNRAMHHSRAEGMSRCLLRFDVVPVKPSLAPLKSHEIRRSSRSWLDPVDLRALLSSAGHRAHLQLQAGNGLLLASTSCDVPPCCAFWPPSSFVSCAGPIPAPERDPPSGERGPHFFLPFFLRLPAPRKRW